MEIDLVTLPLDEDGIAVLGSLHDEELVAAVSGALSVPRTEMSSFTLHAPLELLARAELLPSVRDGDRERARLRLAALAQGFLRAGDPVPEPPPLDLDATSSAVALLAEAVAEADPDGADAATAWLAGHASAGEIARLLAGPTLLEMGAAGHAPILLAGYGRRPDADAMPLRGVSRQLAAHPDLRVGPAWFRRDQRADGRVDDLGLGLGGIHGGGDPGFGVFLIVAAAHRDGVLQAVPRVTEGDRERAFRVLLRTAARSMLDDDPRYAPYGWSHALTMPLGLLQTAPLHGRLDDALDLATLLVAGFRHAHGSQPLAESGRDRGPARDWEELATAASVGHDAHLVKYVLACRHAARLDPDQARLYAHAAGRLVDWWAEHTPADDPLGAPRSAA